jgi:hypothetical protein
LETQLSAAHHINPDDGLRLCLRNVEFRLSNNEVVTAQKLSSDLMSLYIKHIFSVLCLQGNFSYCQLNNARRKRTMCLKYRNERITKNTEKTVRNRNEAYICSFFKNCQLYIRFYLGYIFYFLL